MESRKMTLVTLLVGQQRTHRQNRLVDTVGEGEGGMM